MTRISPIESIDLAMTEAAIVDILKKRPHESWDAARMRCTLTVAAANDAYAEIFFSQPDKRRGIDGQLDDDEEMLGRLHALWLNQGRKQKQ